MMTDERKDELEKLFLIQNETNVVSLKKLEIQEIVFLIWSARKITRRIPNVNFDEKFKVLLNELQNKIKDVEELYIAYDGNTDYPLLDSEGRAWIFLDKYCAKKAKNDYLYIYNMFQIRSVKKENIISEFLELHRLGIKTILMDNGEYHIDVNRDDILVPPDWSNIHKIDIPIVNPELQYAMIRFFQKLYLEDENKTNNEDIYKIHDENEIKELYELFKQIVNAKYIVPVIRKKSSNNIAFQVFTDSMEFDKVFFNGNIRRYDVVSYDELIILSEKCKYVSINCLGIGLKLDKELKEIIGQIRSMLN